MAGAIARPATKTVRATPSCAFPLRPSFDLDLVLRLVRREKRAVVRHLEAAPAGLYVERVGEAAVAEFEVVAVTLAVGGDVDERATIARGALDAVEQHVTRCKYAVEGDGLGHV